MEKTNNELIAEFMGYSNPNDPYLVMVKYHTSWDWLMPVVEKIHRSNMYKAPVTNKLVGVDIEIRPNSCSIYYPNTEAGYDFVEDCWYDTALFSNNHANSESTIIATYNAVVQYIKWYNSQRTINSK